MSVDYYKILNLTKNASDDDIKKSYKKLALQYHPDRNKDSNAEDKFKQISEAYQVLSNKDTKQKYDFGHNINFNNQFNNANDIFKHFFSDNFSTTVLNRTSSNLISTQTSVQIVNGTKIEKSVSIHNGQKIETIIKTKNGKTSKQTIISNL